jgi:hypothetical protein
LNAVIGFAPLCPFRIRDHVVSTPHPSGVTIPRPVTTTRRKALSRRFFCDELYRITNRYDGLCDIIWNLDIKFFFERHHQFDCIKAVGTQIVDQAGIYSHLFWLNAQMLDDDFFNAVRNVAHNLTILMVVSRDGIESVKA